MDTRHVRSVAQRGFTLIEVLLAMSITAVIMVTVGTTFHVLLNARDVVDELAESTEAGPRILNLIERDLGGLWTYNVYNNAVFRGRDMDVNGRDADRIDFLTSTDSVGYVVDLQNKSHKPTVNEVGYWFKPNSRYRDVFEMWRREDPMLDDDNTTQGASNGTFQLVYDRVKSFKVTYFRTLGHEAEEENQWDAAVEDALPKRMKIEFTIERRRGSRNVVNESEIEDFEGAEKTYVRHFVFDQRYDGILAANSARIPVLPPEPVAEEGGGGGGGGPGGAAGGGGAGGPGRMTETTRGSGGKGENVMPGGRNTTTSFGSGRGGDPRTSSGANPYSPGTGNPGNGAQPSFPPGFDPRQFFQNFGNGGGGGNIFGNGGG